MTAKSTTEVVTTVYIEKSTEKAVLTLASEKDETLLILTLLHRQVVLHHPTQAVVMAHLEKLKRESLNS
jgi:hypothetical protein